MLHVKRYYKEKGFYIDALTEDYKFYAKYHTSQHNKLILFHPLANKHMSEGIKKLVSTLLA